MSITATNSRIREVINQVVHDPEYKKVSSVPLLSFQQISIIVLAYLVPFSLILVHIYWGMPLLVAYPIMAIFIYTAFTPLHDCTHRAVSNNNTINDVLGSLSGQVLFPFVTAPAFRYLHLSHHRYVGDKDLDPDERMVSFPTHYYPIGYLLLFVPEVYWVYWIYNNRKRIPTKTKAHLAFTFGLNPIFHAFMLLSPIGTEYCMYFFIPSRLGIWITAFGFAHSPHPEGVKWNDYPFLTTFKLKSNRLILDGLLGQEHHAMHHFLPHVPWYKYFKVWELANGVFKKQFIPEKNIFSRPDKHFTETYKSYLIQEEKQTFLARVSQIEQVATNVKSFTFEPIDLASVPAFEAGAHIDLHLKSGKVRSYSLVNAPFDRNKYTIAVKKEENGRGGSREIHETLLEGDQITLSFPKNNFLLYENADRYILISGGIGITPLISMSHRLTELEKHFEFYVCARSKDQIPFQHALENWSFAPNIEYCLNGRSGLDLSKILAKVEPRTLIYVCGPTEFNQWIRETAQAMGWDKNQIKSEAFHAGSLQVQTRKSFAVHLLKSKKTIMVAEDLSILDSLQLNNISVPYSCLQGTCGTCITDVTAGDIEHFDACLSEDEKMDNKKICLCVSRAKGESLTLDL
ncbi:vanillate O-demethylase ferredoxin subunit [Spirosoma lacussanchae]|uniref:fatty acid desaturase n=1 Tax=Spirosoma lacussanchae TaxID=1884249 RepID=UPI0011083CED|nr:fatty acid desaturase [Spirosoma lacussanchae]